MAEIGLVPKVVLEITALRKICYRTINEMPINEKEVQCLIFFFFSSRRRHTRLQGDWSSDVCSSDLAYETGITTPYALQMAEERGDVFIGPAEKVYAGQIVGLNKRGDDMEMNVCKARSEERRVGKECRSRWSPYH